MGKKARLRAQRGASANPPTGQDHRPHRDEETAGNRYRRRAEQRGASAGTPRGSGPGSSPTREDLLATIADLIQLAVVANGRRQTGDLDDALALLTGDDALGVSTPEVHRQLVRGQLQSRLLASVGELWQRGWQPADVLRMVRRSLKGGHERLVGAVVVAELAGYAPDTLDPRWSSQLAAADLQRWWPRSSGPLAALAETWPGGWRALVRTAVELLALTDHLRPLPQLGPLPGAGRVAPDLEATTARRDVDARVLERVRSLLAKAESTTFPAEAETFTAGAQALMARHSIDAALLAATADRDGTGAAEGVTSVRIGVDAPYDAAKAVLLQEIARANRCRTVWARSAGFTSVVGFPADLSAVEVLYTSLLVQATTGLNALGDHDRAGARSRSASYRRSYLDAYAVRIGERLAEATQQATGQATASAADASAAAGSADLLPVLASRAQAVDDAVDEMFPDIERSSARVRDFAGYASGRAAADSAAIGRGEALPG